MKQTLRLDAGPHARELHVALARNRGAFRVDSVHPVPTASSTRDHALALRWDAPPGPVRIGLTVWGEPVRATATAGPAPGPVPPGAGQRAVFDWRGRRTEFLAEHRAARSFFTDLEAGTLGWEKGRSSLQMLLETLFDSRLRGDPDPLRGYVPGEVVALAIQGMCKTFVAGFDRHFEALADIEEAFDLFAHGELSLLDPDSIRDGEGHGVSYPDMERACQPNSLMFYLFAEFAALCAHLDLAVPGQRFRSPDVWRELLPALVYAHRGFHEVYAEGQRARWTQEIRGVRAPGRAGALRARRAGELPGVRNGLPELWREELRRQVAY